MFSVCHKKSLGVVRPRSDESFANTPVLVEGVEILDAICPVNDLTGTRENPLNLIGLIMNDTRKDLLARLLADVPTVQSMRGLSDSEMVDFLAPRLATGMPAEDDAFTEHLATVASALMPMLRQQAGISQSDVNSLKDVVPAAANTATVEVQPE